ncbi:hypothetical protein Y032_0302g1866 [Ancylostoma ceylanicum]|uniref:Uncharacterized protein n=1 Tax=Ancylostoma ceylanicum TaxID=53326 RepID=A0A016S4F8_9BILA|nr:hypothetical protein Y032_0302g1866 [Ancylostoma ceylanicum]
MDFEISFSSTENTADGETRNLETLSSFEDASTFFFVILTSAPSHNPRKLESNRILVPFEQSVLFTFFC